MISLGDDVIQTGMSKTVGWPLAITTKLLATGKLEGLTGVQRPVMPAVYNPVIEELSAMGIEFIEEEF